MMDALANSATPPLFFKFNMPRIKKIKQDLLITSKILESFTWHDEMNFYNFQMKTHHMQSLQKAHFFLKTTLVKYESFLPKKFYPRVF
jgi:hypothetical protein